MMEDFRRKGPMTEIIGRLGRLESFMQEAKRLWGLGGSGSGGGLVSGPQSIGDNYVITPSVAGGNLTLALKTIAGADPSASDSIWFRIGNVKQTITAAISTVKNSGTDWHNLGSAELATQLVDVFAYAIQETGASAGTKVGWARTGYGKVVGDFSSTTTNQNYLAGPTNYNATDKVECIGRFSVALSAGAGYTWSIPAGALVINHPITTTRVLNYLPAWSASGVAPSLGNGSYYLSSYVIRDRAIDINGVVVFGNTTTFGTGYYIFSVPFNGISIAYGQHFAYKSSTGIFYLGVTIFSGGMNSMRTHGAGATGQLVPFTFAANDQIFWQAVGEAIA